VGRTADDARQGNSTFMLGGAADDKSRVMPVLDVIGNGVIDCGEVGHGMMVKIVNNFMSTVGAVLVGEALRLAEAGGVDTDTVLEVVNGTVAGNGHSKVHYPNKVLIGDIAPGFAIKHARKDCRIAQTVMDRLGLPNFIAPAVAAAYDRAVDGGHGENDWSDMYNVIDELKRDT
jgi:4-hydroxybutyrate dehydrogenase/sulfolactaldehyde 3-reductase